MKMRLVGPLAARRVSPREALDYSAFSMNHSQPGETSELHVFEKFYGANSLVADGFETYTDTEVSDSANQPAIKADVVGRKGEALTLVFCEAGDSGPDGCRCRPIKPGTRTHQGRKGGR